jgi:hypothetical protein
MFIIVTVRGEKNKGASDSRNQAGPQEDHGGDTVWIVPVD